MNRPALPSLSRRRFTCVSTVREQSSPGLHSVPPLGERHEQLELECGERDLVRADGHAVRLPVDPQLAHFDHPLLGRVPATEDSVDAEHQLANAEGLHHVVVGAKLEADDAIDLFGLRGHHDDRHGLRLRLATKRLDDARARQVRQHQIEQDDVWANLERELEAGFSVRGGKRTVARLNEVVLEDLPQVGFVLDHEHSRHGRQRQARLQTGGAGRVTFASRFDAPPGRGIGAAKLLEERANLPPRSPTATVTRTSQM